MLINIEGIRPALLTTECYDILNELRGFRHVFRHSYSYKLDERKIKLLIEDVLKLEILIKNDIKRFCENLGK